MSAHSCAVFPTHQDCSARFHSFSYALSEREYRSSSCGRSHGIFIATLACSTWTKGICPISFHACLHWFAPHATLLIVEALLLTVVSSQLLYEADAAVFPVVRLLNAVVTSAGPSLPTFCLRPSCHFLSEAAENHFVSSERSPDVFGPYDFGG